jgi:plasmid stability protein
MPNVLVRDLPEPVHAELQRRARANGQSLQQYLVQELARMTDQPTVEQVLERIAGRTGGTVGLDQAIDDLGQLRGER